MELLLVIFCLGYICQHAGSGLLIWQIKQKRSIEGLSEETQVLFLIGSLLRCIWVFDTRLMYFPLVWVDLLLSLVVSIYIVFLFLTMKDSRYHTISNLFKLKYLIPFCCIMAFFFHPGEKGKYYFSIQMLVSLSMYLEAIGLLPQIYLMRKIRTIDVRVGKYVMLLGLSRVIRMFFWIKMYIEGDTFIYLILADLLHTLLICDFVYYYITSRKGDLIIIS